MVEAGHPGLTRRLEQGLGADHVGAEEPAGLEDGQAVVGLRGEVDDDLGPLALEDPLHQLEVADVAFDEADPVPDGLERRQGGGVGEDVEHDELVTRMRRHPVVDEVRADEAGPAGHQQSHACRD